MKTPLMTNIQLEYKPYPDRETLGDFSQKDHGDGVLVSNDSIVQFPDFEALKLAKDRTELRSIIDGEQGMSGLSNRLLVASTLELSKPSGNPISKLYSTLSELQTGMEGMLADEKNPVIRFGIKISLKLNQFSLFLLSDMLDLQGKRGEEMEEDKEEKRKNLALLKGMQINSNALKRLMRFGILDFLNILRNNADHRFVSQQEQELATQI